MTDSPSLEPSIALAAYVEPLATNRRVLVLGNALGALSLQLLERGARVVHVSDPDPLRVSEAVARNRSSQISFSTLADGDLSLREGAFELAVIENLGSFNATSVLGKAHRALTPRGVAVVACPNPEAAFPLLRLGNPSATVLDYYALYDAVAAEFEHVRMLGQTPFVGYAIADFSASGEPEPALDTSFVPGGAEEPDLFIALAAGHELRLDEFAVIQLPTRQLLASIGAASDSGAVNQARDAERKAQRRIGELESRLKKSEKVEAPPAPAPVDNRELLRLNQWIGELEARASTADERADHAETELEELRGQLEAEQKTHEALKARHDKEQGELRAELSNKSGQLASATATLAERDRKLSELTGRVEQEENPELAELERQLVERGAEIRRLEQELRTAERTGRELVREVSRRSTEQAALGSAELERALAEREADLQAAAWTIESLSLRLELSGKPTNAGLPETAIAGDGTR